MKSIASNISIWVFILSMMLTSCFKEDEIIYIPKPSANETDTVVLGNNYNLQYWVDLNGLQEKAVHDISDWDLAFSCSENNFTIRLNSAKMMYAGTNGIKDFDLVISEEGIDMNFDASSGNPDSLAFGGWYEPIIGGIGGQSYEYVYVVNRGIDGSLTELGYKKIIVKIDNNDYVIRYANLDGTEEQSLSIAKNSLKNYVHFSFDTGIIEIEPPQNEWSILFSRYSTILFTNEGDPYDYNVVGVLLNPNNVWAVETDLVFEDFVLSDTSLLDLSNRADVIGYDWKYYDFDSGSYTIEPDKNYIIRDKDGFYYKMRFLSFYDEFGNKGSIVYQVIRL